MRTCESTTELSPRKGHWCVWNNWDNPWMLYLKITMQKYKCIQFVYMRVRYIIVFVKRGIFWKVMLICSCLNNYVDIAGETWKMPQKLNMFNEFRLIVNSVGKSDWMSTDFRIFRDGLDISTHYKQTYFICTHLYFSIKDEMFNIRIKCHPGGSMTLRGVHK